MSLLLASPVSVEERYLILLQLKGELFPHRRLLREKRYYLAGRFAWVIVKGLELQNRENKSVSEPIEVLEVKLWLTDGSEGRISVTQKTFLLWEFEK